jgi:hypothetical protein
MYRGRSTNDSSPFGHSDDRLYRRSRGEGVWHTPKANWTTVIDPRGTVSLLHSLRNPVCTSLKDCDDTDRLRAAQRKTFGKRLVAPIRRPRKEQTTTLVKSRSSTIVMCSCFDLDGETFPRPNLVSGRVLADVETHRISLDPRCGMSYRFPLCRVSADRLTEPKSKGIR